MASPYYNVFSKDLLQGIQYSNPGVDNSFISSLLEEFKSNKTKSFELAKIVGHVLKFRCMEKFIYRFFLIVLVFKT